MNPQGIGKCINRQTQNESEKNQHGPRRIVRQQKQKDQVVEWRDHPEDQDVIENQHLQ